MTLLTRWSRLVLTFAVLVAIAACVKPRGAERVLEVRPPTAYLRCPPPATWPDSVTRQVGSAGDTLRMGLSYFVIPPNAIPANRPRTITISPVRADTVGVYVRSSTSDGFLNGLSATLVVDATRCGNAIGDTTRWSIWRMRGNSNGQRLRTLWAHGRALAPLDSTSKYMIAN